jgi:O-antigen/teichoic acid export membrane protein
MADIWIRATRLIGAISIPALVGLVVVAPDFVHVVLGSKWKDATPVIQILALVGVIQSLHTLNAEVLLALNKAGTLVRYTTLWVAATTGAVAVGVQWDIVGVAISYAVATVLVEPIRAYITTQALGIPLSRFIRSLSGVAQATAAMAAVLLAGRAALIALDAPALLRLALLVPLGAAVYVAASLWRVRELTDEIRGVLARRRQTPAPIVDPLETGLLEH